MKHQIIAVVGQLVDMYGRSLDNPNQRTQFAGATCYKLSRLTKVSHVTIAKYMKQCEALGYVTSEIEPYRNTTRTKYYPTNKAVNDWKIWKYTDEGIEARMWVANNWMNWYRKQVRTVYRKCGIKPFFRV
jgi:hypothetical protein